MKPTIIQPELAFDMERYSMGPDTWTYWKDLLNEISCIVKVESRQYLEDCIENTTALIAEQGKISYLDAEIDFVAQLDFQGYALYVSKDLRKNQSLGKLLSILENEFQA